MVEHVLHHFLFFKVLYYFLAGAGAAFPAAAGAAAGAAFPAAAGAPAAGVSAATARVI